MADAVQSRPALTGGRLSQLQGTIRDWSQGCSPPLPCRLRGSGFADATATVVPVAEELPQPLITEARIAERVEQLAAEISEEYAAVDEIFLIGVLRGAFIFLADLSRQLTIPRRVDFIAVSSYGQSDRHSGAVRLVMDVRTSLEGRHVLIVEDIVDTGLTLEYLKQLLGARGAASIKTCALVRKPTRHRVPVDIDYLGFEIDDVWVVGYGLDYADRYRTLPYIGIVEPDVSG